MHRLILITLLVLLVGAQAAHAQAPDDPEPIQDFWSQEADASPSRDGAPAATSPAVAPAGATSAPTVAAAPAADPAPAAGSPAPTPVPASDACTPQVTLDRALVALRDGMPRRLPAYAGRRIRVRLTPCAPGRLILQIRHGATVLARADRTLRSTRPATFTLRTTRAIERLRGKRIHLRLRVLLDLTP